MAKERSWDLKPEALGLMSTGLTTLQEGKQGKSRG